MTEKKGRGRISGKRDPVSDWRGGGRWLTKELKTNMISAAVEKTPCLLPFGACLATCSRGWAQHCAMTLRLSAFCLGSRRILRWQVCTGKRSGENEADCMGRQVSVDTVA